MRRQLGKDYGKRVAYGQFPAGGNLYFPFSRRALEALKKKVVPESGYIQIE